MWQVPDKRFIPLNAPVAGYEIGVAGINDPAPIFIIRAKYQNGIHSGKWVYGNTAWVPWGGKEYHVEDFEIYVGPIKWAAVKGKDLPTNAIECGHESDGRKLYIARATFEKGIFPGKAGRHLSKGCCVGYMGKEYELDEYEVLVHE